MKFSTTLAAALICTVGLATPALAQNAECAAKDANGQQLFGIGNGETVMFVDKDSPVLRQLRGPKVYHHADLYDRVAAVELQKQCRFVIRGGFGAPWGHKNVAATGPVGVASKEVAAMECSCK